MPWQGSRSWATARRSTSIAWVSDVRRRRIGSLPGSWRGLVDSRRAFRVVRSRPGPATWETPPRCLPLRRTCGRIRPANRRSGRSRCTRPTTCTTERTEMATEPLPVTGAWRTGRSARQPQVLHVRHRPPVRGRERRRAPRRRRSPTRRGARSTATPRTRSSSATRGRATRTPPVEPVPVTWRPDGGTTWSDPAPTSTPTSTSSCAPTCSAAARVRPDRRRRIPTTAARTARASRSSRSATWFAIRSS